MKTALVNSSPRTVGTGRYALEIFDRLNDKHPMDHIFLNYGEGKIERIDRESSQTIARIRKYVVDYKHFFYYRSQRQIPRYDLYHIATQNLSYLDLHPKIVTCLDIYYHLFPASPIQRIYSRLTLSGIAKAERIITISRFIKNQIVAHLNYPEERVSVVYEGVDHEKYRPVAKDEGILRKYGLPQNTRLILYVGSEHPRKNLPLLVAAFAKLRLSMPDVTLVKVGGPDVRGERKKLLQTIGRFRLQDAVMFTGYVPEEDLPKLYNAADLYVSPTLYEGGFALPVLEAMACGVPTVSSNIPPLVETVGNGGLLVDPTDANALAEAMHRVLTDPTLRHNVVDRGLERAKLFTWERAAEDTLAVYQKVYQDILQKGKKPAGQEA